MRTMSRGLLLAVAALAISCGPKSGSDEASSSTASASPQVNTSEATDTFVFRDAETGAVLPESDIPGNQENATYSYLATTAKRWPNGVIKWWYNPAGEPAGFGTQATIDALIAAGKRWEQVCKVSFQYQGTTTNPLTLSGCNGATVVGWTPLAGSVIGQTQDCFSSTTISEMDLGLDNTQITSLSLMQTVAVHEFGHSFGLGHTDLAVAVMTPSLTTGTPVQDDINGCQSLYGVPSTTTSPTPVCTASATQTCAVSNGSGRQTCSADGMSWGSCAATTCNSGFALTNGVCVANTTTVTKICQPNQQYSCSTFSGRGYKTCSADGTAYSTCQINRCKVGYHMVSGQCVK